MLRLICVLSWAVWLLSGCLPPMPSMQHRACHVQQLPSAPPPRVQATLTWAGDRFILLGGLHVDGTVAGDIWTFRPGDTEWKLSAQQLFRVGHTTLWTGTELLIFGGQTENGPTASLLRWSGQDDESPRAETLTVTARTQHSALWTGSEMWIIGGLDSDGIAILSPFRWIAATGTVETLVAPRGVVGRSLPIWLWLGDRALLWGGSNPEAMPAEFGGAVYRQESQSWASISLSEIAIPTVNPSALRVEKELWLGLRSGVVAYDWERDRWRVVDGREASGATLIAGHESGKIARLGGRHSRTEPMEEVTDTVSGRTLESVEMAGSEWLTATASERATSLMLYGWSQGTQQPIGLLVECSGRN